MMDISKDKVESWMCDTWVVYALAVKYQKRMRIRVGTPHFQVTHGNELVYDGKSMIDAIDVYNSIQKPFDPDESPKIHN